MTFIQNNQNQYTLSQLCSVLKFPRSTYYKTLVCVPSNRQKEYEEFDRKVKQAYDNSKQRYSAVKICRTLNGNGTPCSRKRVQRHIAQQGIRSVVVKIWLPCKPRNCPRWQKKYLETWFWGKKHQAKMVYRYYLHPCAERRLDLSGADIMKIYAFRIWRGIFGLF